MTCHTCGVPLTTANDSRVPDTCETCLTNCHCWVCTDTRAATEARP